MIAAERAAFSLIQLSIRALKSMHEDRASAEYTDDGLTWRHISRGDAIKDLEGNLRHLESLYPDGDN